MPKLSDIARTLGIDVPDTDRELSRVAKLPHAGASDLAYVTSEKYLGDLDTSAAGVVIVSAKLNVADKPGRVLLKVKDAELALASVLPLFAPPPSRPTPGIHPSAVVDASATVGEGSRVGPNVVVGPNATIGRNVVLHPGVVVGEAVVVGDDCELFPNVVLRERVRLGRRVVIHANSTLGTDGFGYRWDGKRHAKIPQIGDVEIGDDVEIGSNTCIDRAKFGTTRIGPGTKIDNLVQIGHNVETGAHCIICGQAGLAGSATLGNGVVMGGNSGATNHVHIADGTTVAARGGILNDTKAGEVLAGAPAVPHRDWLRERANVARLPELIKALRHLEREVEQLKTERRNTGDA